MVTLMRNSAQVISAAQKRLGGLSAVPAYELAGHVSFITTENDSTTSAPTQASDWTFEVLGRPHTQITKIDRVFEKKPSQIEWVKEVDRLVR